MKAIFASGLTQIARFFDDSIGVESINDFLRAELRSLSDQESPDQAKADVRRANTLLSGEQPACTPRWTTEECLQWRNSLTLPSVLSKGVLARGTGAALYSLDCHGVERPFVDANLESLLRHVEVKRRQALQKISPAVEEDELWLERQDVAILFISATARRQDLRFLNAALKLNDWSYREYTKRRRNVSSKARFLLALAEQEGSMRSLEPCA